VSKIAVPATTSTTATATTTIHGRFEVGSGPFRSADAWFGPQGTVNASLGHSAASGPCGGGPAVFM
jgi:hypothetical protein